MKHKTDNVLFIFYLLSFSHKQYGGKTYPFLGRFYFFIIFFKKSVDKLKNMIYIIYRKLQKRGEKILKNENRTTSRCFLMTKEEDLKLQKDAHAHEMNISAYLRWLIKQEHEKKERE